MKRAAAVVLTVAIVEWFAVLAFLIAWVCRHV